MRVYPNHPDGIVSIKFRSEEAAEACLKLMHGRFFGGRQVTCLPTSIMLSGACTAAGRCWGPNSNM